MSLISGCLLIYLWKALVKKFEEVKATVRQTEGWAFSDRLWGQENDQADKKCSCRGSLALGND